VMSLPLMFDPGSSPTTIIGQDSTLSKTPFKPAGMMSQASAFLVHPGSKFLVASCDLPDWSELVCQSLQHGAVGGKVFICSRALIVKHAKFRIKQCCSERLFVHLLPAANLTVEAGGEDEVAS